MLVGDGPQSPANQLRPLSASRLEVRGGALQVRLTGITTDLELQVAGEEQPTITGI